jgi:Tfp pilus assembly protein PilO
MFKDKDKIKAEIKSLIATGNLLLNANQNKQKVTAYLYIIFSLFALSFFGIFAIGPTITTISNLNKQYDDGKTALKELQDKNAALKSLGAQYIDIQPDLPLIDNAIPQSPKIAELTRQLEVLATNNTLVVQKLNTGLIELYPAKNVNSPIFSYTFSINVIGAQDDVNNFTADVINMGRIISIEKLTTGKQQDNIFSSSITGKAFFYKP